MFWGKILLGIAIMISVFTISAHFSQARGRFGSTRIGGFTSHGKGSHYVGGRVRSCHGIFCR